SSITSVAPTVSSLLWSARVTEVAAAIPSASRARSPTARITMATSTSMRVNPSAPRTTAASEVTIHAAGGGDGEGVAALAHGGDDGAGAHVAHQAAPIEDEPPAPGGGADFHPRILGT